MSYVTRYSFGEVAGEENKRNGGRRQILKSFILLQYGQKGGNVTSENWELKISTFWRVEGNADLSFSLSTEVKKKKNNNKL